jgi:hypothetical protein
LDRCFRRGLSVRPGSRLPDIAHNGRKLADRRGGNGLCNYNLKNQKKSKKPPERSRHDAASFKHEISYEIK